MILASVSSFFVSAVPLKAPLEPEHTDEQLRNGRNRAILLRERDGKGGVRIEIKVTTLGNSFGQLREQRPRLSITHLPHDFGSNLVQPFLHSRLNLGSVGTLSTMIRPQLLYFGASSDFFR